MLHLVVLVGLLGAVMASDSGVSITANDSGILINLPENGSLLFNNFNVSDAFQRAIDDIKLVQAAVDNKRSRLSSIGQFLAKARSFIASIQASNNATRAALAQLETQVLVLDLLFVLFLIVAGARRGGLLARAKTERAHHRPKLCPGSAK